MDKDVSAKKILVLGGGGFIGSHLVDKLLEIGYSVKLFERPYSVFLGQTNTKNIELIYGDFTCEADIASAVLDCDICFHLISTVLPKSSNLDPIFDIETNLIGSVRLLNHAVRAGIKKIIFLSSGGTIYGLPRYLPIDEHHPTNPLCSYGITKLAIEKYLHLYHESHGLDYTVLRIANPFGERQRIQSPQGAVAVFTGKALRKEKIEIWGDGAIIRDYIHVSDVVSAMIKAISYSGNEHVFNIGSGQGTSLNSVLDSIEYIIGNKLIRCYTPERSFDVPQNVLNIKRADEALNWKPETSFASGIERTVSWLIKNELGAIVDE